MPMTRLSRSLWVLPLLLSLAACPGGGPTRLGAVLPLTGGAALYGTAIQRGVELAYEQAQQDPKGPKVALTVLDSASDPEKARQALDQLYDDGAIAVMGGVTSAEALAMIPAADQQGAILLSPSASLPQLTGISSNFYRIFPSDFAEGTVMAKYAYDTLRLKTAVILAKQETYAKGIQEVFADELRRKGGQILEQVDFPANTSDFAALADRAATLKPDCVYVAAYAEEISHLVRELRGHGYTGTILTTSSFAAGGNIANTGAAAEGVLFTQSAFDVEGNLPEQVKAFVAAYRAKYKTDPDLYAAHGYDAMKILVEAVRDGNKTASTFWKGLRNLREYPGVTGIIQFDEKGDVSKFPRVYVVADGRAVDREQERQRQLEEARRKIQEIENQLRQMKQGN
jgi:branched-chain amino acid transport system substrate-binding protein